MTVGSPDDKARREIRGQSPGRVESALRRALRAGHEVRECVTSEEGQ